MQNMFVQFDSPNHIDVIVVLQEIRKVLDRYKSEMTACGPMRDFNRKIFRDATGVSRGRAVPPRYTKKITSDD